MKRIIHILAVLSVAALVACEQVTPGGGTGSSGTTHVEKEVDNESINQKVFALLDKQNEGLKPCFDLFETGQYYYAAESLLNYYRNRTSVTDSEISLIAPQITPSQKEIADQALSEKLENLVARPQLDWIEAQGLAYRTSCDEAYAKSWVNTMDSFIGATDTVNVWNAEDASARLQALTSAWQYFMQSVNVTPAFTSKMLEFIAEDGQKLYEAAEEGSPLLLTLGRLAKVFPEFNYASEWLKKAHGVENQMFEKAWFEVLDMNAPGLGAVKTAYDAGELKDAAEALLKYWRSRAAAVNPNIDFSNVTISDQDLAFANAALRENGFRFYVKNFFSDSAAQQPYSYLAADNSSIDWTYWPTKDQEQRYQLHRHQWMIKQAKAFYVTRDEKFVRGWMEVYQDWQKQNPRPSAAIDYTIYPENLDAAYRNAGWSWRPLDVAARLIDECEIIEYVKSAASLTPEYLLWFLYHFAEQADHIRNNYSATSNHLITQAQAVASAGILFPEFKNSAAWISSGVDKLNSQIEEQYYADGWLKDGDFHYHISSIEDFRQIYELARVNGKESMISFKPGLQKLADVVLNMTYPDYSSVNMTDTRSDTWSRSVLTRNFTRYADLFPENGSYLWMATGGGSGTKPSNLAKNFPDCGYYVLRSGWNSSDIMMVLQNATQSPYEKWHRQWDNNTFELYVKGRHFFVDSGCYTYTTGSNRSKYAATSAHNTLTLDGKNVSSCRGTMVKSATQGRTDVLVLSNPSYSGLTHRRTVFFVERAFFVIVDEAYGSAAGTVNLHFHLPPQQSSASDIVVDEAVNQSYTAFADGNNLLVKTISDAALTTTSRDGFLSTNIDKSVTRKAYKVDQTKSADAPARYVTVILPSKTPASETVNAVFPSAFDEAKVSADVTVGTTVYNLSINL